MPRPHDGTPSRRARGGRALRSVGITCAVLLAALAVWLIVTSTSQKWIEIGVLAGLWGLLLGAFSMLGSRQPTAARGEPTATAGSALERHDDLADRRDYELRLVQLLRREIQVTIAGELDGLRADVAALRTELVDKAGAPLRLERVETTRVFGSDIEGLQHEVNQLKAAQRRAELPGVGEAAASALATSNTIEMAAIAADPVPNAPHAVAPSRHRLPAEQSSVVEHTPVVEHSPVLVQSAALARGYEPVPDEAPVAAPQHAEPAVLWQPQPARHEREPAVLWQPEPARHEREPAVLWQPQPQARVSRPEPEPAPDADGLPEASAERPAGAVRSARHAHGGGALAPRHGGRRRREPGADNDVLQRVLQREGYN